MTPIEISELRKRFNDLVATTRLVELHEIDASDCARVKVFINWARMEVPRLLEALESSGDLMEISEREVIEKAKAWARAIYLRKVKDEPGEPEIAATVELYEAVLLLHSREIAEQALDTGTVPQPGPATFELPVFTGVTYPPMAEGQCHWESGGEIVAYAPECQHVADSSTINDEGKSGNASFLVDGLPAPRPGAESIPSGFSKEELSQSQKDAIEQMAEYFKEHSNEIPANLKSPEMFVREGARLANSRAGPSPRLGAEPIPRRPKKLSRKAQAIEARRLADVSGLAAGRDDIDYESDELPSAR